MNSVNINGIEKTHELVAVETLLEKEKAKVEKLRDALERASSKLIFALKGSTFIHMEAALCLMQDTLEEIEDEND